MKTLKVLSKVLALYMWLFPFISFAQNVGINDTGTAPDASALLDLSSTNKGFLITRADTANIGSPAFGLMTLSPNDSCLYLFNGVSWMGMGGAGNECICGVSSGSGSSYKCGSPFEDIRDNQTYETVEIGNQCWMKENLNYTPSSGSSWCYENNNNNCLTYGRLYDWDAAMNNTSTSSANPSGVQGVCPTDWHLPSDDEWKELEMFLGMSQIEADNTLFRGTTEGAALKASIFGGNNSSGFTALPGGSRNTNGSFYSMGSYGYWWSATEGGNGAWRRYLLSSRSDVYRFTMFKSNGFSVRCIKD